MGAYQFRRRHMAVAGMVVAAATALSACSSSGSGGTTSTGASSPAPVTSDTVASTTAPVSSAASTGTGPSTSTSTGSGPATGSTITLGMLDPTSGGQAFPAVATGAKAAVKYVNDHGGLMGHPIAIDACDTDSTPETALNCANKFVTAKLPAVFDMFEIGSGAALPALDAAKIPMIGNIAFNGTANESKTSFYYGPASQAYSVGPLYELSKKGVKTVAFAAPDDAGDHAYFDKNIIPVGKALGMNLTVTYFNATTGANWQVIAATLKSKNPDLAGLASGAEGSCTSLLKALRSAGYTKTILLGGCSSFVQDDKSQAQGVLSYTGTWVPIMAKNAPANVQADLKTYQAAMAAVNAPAADISTQRGTGAFSAILTTVNILNAQKVALPLTGAAITTAMRATKNFPVFLGANATCDGNQWPGTSSCINSIMLTSGNSDGTISPLTNPAFSPLDTSLLKVG